MPRRTRHHRVTVTSQVWIMTSFCLLLALLSQHVLTTAAFEAHDKLNFTKLFGLDSDRLKEINEVKAILHQYQQETAEEETNSTEDTETDDSSSSFLFEGDIMLTVPEAEDILESSRSRHKRKITAQKDHLWPLPIPYRFNKNPKYVLNNTERVAVQNAMAEISRLTCITFKEVDDTYPIKPVLDFMKDYGCWSYVGRETSFQYQEISTAEECFKKGVLLHELGHALGFWHEQSRPDRDSFVNYLKKNVKKGEDFNFNRETWGEIKNLGVPYDVGSIMHYGARFFSKNDRQPTLVTKDPLLQRDLGQRRAMSFYDVKLANMVYCADSCPKARLDCLHGGYPDPKDCTRCRCPDGLSGTLCQYSAPSRGGARCGGPLLVENGARYTIRSPGYPWAYLANTECTWLLQARSGMRLYMEVKPEHFMTHRNCPKSNLTVCQDYLEIKYNLSFGYTGARFCCGEAPKDVIVSRGNTMLVLFRTFRGGIGGFQADVYTEPCGGCYQTAELQKPCHLTDKVSCRQTWYKMEYVQCPDFFLPPTYVCNKYLRRKHTRDSTCEVEVPKCCHGYPIKNGFCVPPDRKDTTTSTNTDNNNNNNSNNNKGSKHPDRADVTTDVTDSKNPAVTSEPPNSLVIWSPWSSCSRSCGGCGRRSRSRKCQNKHDCGDDSGSTQTQICNTQPCPHYQAYACPQTIEERYNCGWLKYCTRTRTEMRQCVTRCCPNYEDKNSVCQPVSANRRRKK